MLSDHDRKIIEQLNRGKISHRTAIAELDALVMTHDQLYEFMLENGYALEFALKPECSDPEKSSEIFGRNAKENNPAKKSDKNIKKDE